MGIRGVLYGLDLSGVVNNESAIISHSGPVISRTMFNRGAFTEVSLNKNHLIHTQELYCSSCYIHTKVVNSFVAYSGGRVRVSWRFLPFM